MSVSGEKITIRDGKLAVPSNPVIPFIEGDGIGPDIWRAAVRVFDAAVEKAYKGSRKIQWLEVLAGEKAFNKTGSWLPSETLDAFKEYLVGIKGPLTTPIGGGIRSLNVALRQELDLYVCQRPVRYFSGVDSPVKRPDLVDMVIFRENTEDIYAGIEFENGTEEVEELKAFLKDRFPKKFKSVTLVHKGNIMKFTEGAFRDWGYKVAKEQFGAVEIDGGPWCKLPCGIIIKDVIADAFLQQILTRPAEYDIVATLNLNGDYISDALAAQVGGIGIAPGGNINYTTGHAIFEATHGTAPKYANLDKVNPGSVILSGEMMFRYLGWNEAADLIITGLENSIKAKTVTYDLARLIEGAKEVKCSEFGSAIIANL